MAESAGGVVPSRRDEVSLAQSWRAGAGVRAKSREPSPVGTIEVSIVPTRLESEMRTEPRGSRPWLLSCAPPGRGSEMRTELGAQAPGYFRAPLRGGEARCEPDPGLTKISRPAVTT